MSLLDLPATTAVEATVAMGSTEFLGEPDQKSFRPPDVAKPVRVLVLDDVSADELGAVVSEPGERVVQVVDGKHHAQVAQSVDWRGPVIGDHRRREKSRELETAVAVRRAHHGDLDTLLAESGNAARPLSFCHGLAFELQAEGAKELNRRLEVLDDDSYVVHPLNRHAREVYGRQVVGLTLRLAVASHKPAGSGGRSRNGVETVVRAPPAAHTTQGES